MLLSSPLLIIFSLEFYLDSGKLLLITPALINYGLLISFGWSFFIPPTVVETFARIYINELSPEHLRYCRRVTLLWCFFFAFNSCFAAFTAYLALHFGYWGFWTFYNGILNYIFVALLLILETTYRYWKFRVYTGAPTDPIFIKLFPPPSGV